LGGEEFVAAVGEVHVVGFLRGGEVRGDEREEVVDAEAVLVGEGGGGGVALDDGGGGLFF
jgi:hypothetical protein